MLTHPAHWGLTGGTLLAVASPSPMFPTPSRAPSPRPLPPEYAAHTRLSPGDKVAVYDLGGGKFDVCVLEKQAQGFRIIGHPDGIEHLGGIDFDEAVLRHVLRSVDSAPPGHRRPSGTDH